MLSTQFIGLNLFFAVNLLAALVCFAVFWLIFDAWTARHPRMELIKMSGFFLLSIGFLLRATTAQTGEGIDIYAVVANGLRALGYIAIILGQILDPLQPRPIYASSPSTDPGQPAATGPAAPESTNRAYLFGPWAGMALPLLALVSGAMYLRRATTGLEKHLKPVAWGFFALAVFEFVSNLGRLQNTSNPTLYQLTADYGPAWWLAVVVLALAAFILGGWVWQYLTKRLQMELFIILVAQTLVLFLFSTVGFTFLLLQNIQKQSLADLGTASRVLEYAVNSRSAETSAQAEAVAARAQVTSAVAARDHNALAAALSGYLQRHSLTSLTITDAGGQVLLRGEDPERWGDSRSSDTIVRRAVIGEASTSVAVHDGAVAPSVDLVAATPIRDSTGTIIGVAVAGRGISGAFVDGIRASTGLESAVYGGNVRAATTLASPGTNDRAIGIKESSAAVNNDVLAKNHNYTGTVSFQNRPYLAAFTPLRDANNVPVGMLMVARPSDSLYAAANDSIRLTFLFVVALILCSIYPVFLISKFLSRQLK